MKRGKKNSHIFQLCYPDLCSSHNIPMIFSIKAHLHKKMLEFNADRVKLDEWRPILRALSLDRSLHYIAIQSKHSYSKVLENMDSETKCRAMVKIPVLYSSFIFRKLIDSLTSCVSNNFNLKCLELDGLLLSEEYLSTLIMGLRRSSSIQHLSLHRCPLGDAGCELISHYLRFSPNIVSIDMSGCNISEKGAYFIAKTLEFQNLNRYGENWKQSLRYRTPDTEIMPGLRRVTLNHNPNMGDLGVEHFIDVLRDDLWLKALDLQNVGLTNRGGEIILNLLQANTCLSVLDVQNNPGLDNLLLHNIMAQLASNNKGRVSEHHWIKDDMPFLRRKQSSEVGNVSLHQTNCKTDECAHGQACNVPAVRLTKSSVLPSSKLDSSHRLQKAHSACGIRGPCCNQHISRGLLNRHYRAIIRDLSLRLEEETRKRLEAERQNQILETKHKQFIQDSKQAMIGQVRMDKRLVEEINDALVEFYGFLSVFSKSGLARQLSFNGMKSTRHLSAAENKFVPALSSTCFSAVSETDGINDDHLQWNGKEPIGSAITMIRSCDSLNSSYSHLLCSDFEDSSSTLHTQVENFATTESPMQSQPHSGQSQHPFFPTQNLDNYLEPSQQEFIGGTALGDVFHDTTLTGFVNRNLDDNTLEPKTEDSSQSWLTI